MKPEKEKQDPLQEHQQERVEEPEANTQITEKAGILCCPECGSSRIRKRSIYFFFSIAVFIGLLLLKMVVIDIAGDLIEANWAGWLCLALLGICYFWPAIICGAACFALVGRHHCLNCGYRFCSISEKRQKKDKVLFPWRFSILNSILIFLFSYSGAIYTCLNLIFQSQ